MDKIKPNRINYYILVSLMIHFCFFILFKKEKEVTLGKEIIPIEVFDNLIESGIGEDTKKSKRVTQKVSLKEKKSQKPIDQMNSFENNEINKNINFKKVEINKSKTNNLNQTILKEKKGSGSREGIENNEPEKGSLRGEGKIEVTCLKCIRPIYPPIALRKGIEGKATIKIWINKNGKVTKAELVTRSGSNLINNASLKAALSSTFYPLNKNAIIDIEYDLKIK